jgi:putative phosphoribosyl transferase
MFVDRVDAANKLCSKLSKFSNKEDVVIVGLMRGGMVTAGIISNVLSLKLRALLVKKISDPSNSELAIGAIISLKDIFLNKNLIKKLNISELEVSKLIFERRKDIQAISKKFKINYKGFTGKTVILVDDGVATGATAMVAEQFLKNKGASKIYLATPVIANDTFKIIKKHFSGIIYLIKENSFYSVGQYYRNFEQVLDEEVAILLTIRH